MPRELTDIEMLSELEPIAETNLNRHLAVATEWHPHDYVPWDRGRNFAVKSRDVVYDVVV
ncbi:Probable acyl-[acyl-carrier protein] desaturase [Mycobacteroides abscessus subsp. abscessus]|nr:Probable acyl-[acyl-carrier protein] desaturase [Mycobacteroides abscessus subsp. abscessus]